jgi:Ca-activated chloride channel family protein
MSSLTKLRRHLLAAALLGAPLTPSIAQAHGRLTAVTESGEEGTIALVEERLTVDIDRQYADTTLRQVYVNRSEERLEGRYTLQAGEGAKVHGFSYWNGATRIVGEVLEQTTAAEIYEEVTGLGGDPGLLEESGEGAFSFRVFPIAPGEKKPVEVDYHRRLERDGDRVLATFPLARPKATATITLRDERGIADLRSDSHALEVKRVDDAHVEVRVGAPKGKPSELSLSWAVGAAPWTLDAVVHRDKGQDGYMVVTMATPDTPPTTRIGKDVTLVLDVSGSMAGPPLEQAKLAAVDVLGRLGSDDRVNVVLFDDGVDKLFNTPRAVDSATRKDAVAFVKKARDDGGTDIAQALKESLAAQLRDDKPDVILFLTDGQSDTQETLKVAAADKGDARVFTIGVGDGVERPLLSRLASTKRGRFTFIDSPEAIGRKMAKLYDTIETPMMVDLTLSAKGATVTRIYPQSLPDLYASDELVVAARVRGEGPTTLTLTGRRGGKVESFDVTVQVPKQRRRPWVGRTWAEARTADLLEEIALAGETEELVEEATELALAYDIVTPYTAFLAIPASELTDSTSETLAEARARKSKILAANPDAAALSRDIMPPGDPVLSVRAPSNAQQVTAYFPFGLVEDLEWDPAREMWTTRFLVPKGVQDGRYDVKIVVVNKRGAVKTSTVPYTIDSEAPDFEVEVEVVDGRAHITAKSDPALGALREVVVALVDDPATRVELARKRGVFTGTLALPPGRHRVRVVVADDARNEKSQELEIEVP